MRLVTGLMICLTAMGSVSALQPTPAPPATTPIDAFIDPSRFEIGTMRLSPDGKHFALVMPEDSSSSLVVFDRATRKPITRITAGKDEYVADYWWVSDTRIVGEYGAKGDREESVSATGELWGIDLGTGKSRRLFESRRQSRNSETIGAVSEPLQFATVLSTRADAQGRILIGIERWEGGGEAERMRLAWMDTASGALDAQGGALPVRYLIGTLSDASGRLRVAHGFEADGTRKLFVTDAGSADWRLIDDQAVSGRVVEPLAFGKDASTLLVKVSQRGALSHLAQLDITTGNLRKMFQSEYTDVGNIVVGADGVSGYALRTWDDFGGYVFLRPDSAEAQLVKGLMERFPGQQVIATDFSRSGDVAVVFVHADRNPGEYFLYEQANKSLTRLLRARPGLVDVALAPMQPIRFDARDGQRIHGWLTLPPGGDARKAPLVVLPHGGPYGVRDTWGFDSDVQLLASRGYAVLQVNFRGSGGYGWDFELAGHREWGGKMQDDLDDAVTWLATQKDLAVDTDRVCLFGYSYGAYASLMGVARNSSRYRCAIGFSGVYDLAMMSKKGDIKNNAYGRFYLKDVLIQDPEWLKARSPTQLAAAIKSPVLLIHGGQDRRTPVEHAHAMERALKRAGNPPVTLYKDKEAHGFENVDNQKEAYQFILDFLSRNLN